jgi:hypothetical protein
MQIVWLLVQEGSCECIEHAEADNWKGVLFQIGVWA